MPVARPRHARPFLLILLLFLGLPALRAVAADEGPADLLQQARLLEFMELEHADAIRLYKRVYEAPEAEERHRSEAMLGAARCYMARNEPDEAAIWWQRALEAPGTSEAQKRIAKTELEKRDVVVSKKADDEQWRERWKQVEEGRKEEARRALEKAWDAWRQGQVREARAQAYYSMSIVGETDSHRELLREIEASQPDREELVRNLMQFFQTAQIQHYQELRTTVHEHYITGKRLFGKEEWVQADEFFRGGIIKIDESGFLGNTDLLGGDALSQDRHNLTLWLGLTRERAGSAGITLAEEPPRPKPVTRGGGLAREFYGLLAQAFGTRGDETEKLRFFEFAPPAGGSQRAALGSAGFGSGIEVSRQKSELTRARWAERWIRTNVAGLSATRVRPAAAGPKGAGRKPLLPLTRNGNWICAQHRPKVLGEVDKLLARFDAPSESLVLDVHVFTANTVGVVQACEALSANAGLRESGQDLVIPRRLIGECVRLLKSIDGEPLHHLGASELRLNSDLAASMRISANTDHHPQFVGMQPPALALDGENARFGLYLDLYGEALRGVEPGSAVDRAALSVVARVREPQGSVNVPQQRGGLPFTRIPRMWEQRLDSDREIGTAGTLMLIGLRNPFPEARVEGDQLVILIGARPQSTKTPDIPRHPGGSRIVPQDSRLVELSLGALGSGEVIDHVVGDDWPRRRPASEPAGAGEAQQQRESHIAGLIARGAGLVDPEHAPQELPISVHEGRVSGILEPAEVERVQAFIEKLGKHQDDLYEVDVLSVPTTVERANAWAASEGLDPLRSGWWRVPQSMGPDMDRKLRSARSETNVFALARTRTARATQKVGIRKLVVETIVSDQLPRGADGERVRYTAIPGLVEQGLIVEVRPGLEQKTEGSSLRTVFLRIRAARLRSIESVAYPGSRSDEAIIQIPEWFPIADEIAAPALTDGEGVLVLVDLPGVPERKIVVRIKLRKLN